MIKDKAMIIIAVSRYAGAYINLPGAVTSARRLRKWAEQPDEDCNYKILYLADDVYPKIDVNLVREKVNKFVDEHIMDRLVVYFAGHGIVRSVSDQFWLFTDAANDQREGINVEAFRRGLLKCNIGKHNDQLTGQLCLIGDACRNVAHDAIDFYGDPILTRAGHRNRIQLDRFLSTGLGDYSFQIDGSDDRSAYCLFSEVLLSALSGEVIEAIETKDHKFKPAVTNHKLANYLEEEVKARAADAIEENMEPDLLTGIRPPYNFYKRLREPLAVAGPQDLQLAEAIKMAIHDPQKKGSNNQLSTDHKRRMQILSEGKMHIREAFWEENGLLDRRRQFSPNSAYFSTICDFLPTSVAVPRTASVEVEALGRFYEIEATDCDGAPVLIRQGGQWILTPHYPGVVAAVFRDLPGDALLYKPQDGTWDLMSGHIYSGASSPE